MSTPTIPSTVVDEYRLYTTTAHFLAIPEGERFADLAKRVALDTKNPSVHQVAWWLATEQLTELIWPKAPRQPRRPPDDSKVLSKLLAKQTGEHVVKISEQCKLIGNEVKPNQAVSELYSKKQLEDMFRPLLTNGAGAPAPGI